MAVAESQSSMKAQRTARKKATQSCMQFVCIAVTIVYFINLVDFSWLEGIIRSSSLHDRGPTARMDSSNPANQGNEIGRVEVFSEGRSLRRADTEDRANTPTALAQATHDIALPQSMGYNGEDDEEEELEVFLSRSLKKKSKSKSAKKMKAGIRFSKESKTEKGSKKQNSPKNPSEVRRLYDDEALSVDEEDEAEELEVFLSRSLKKKSKSKSAKKMKAGIRFSKESKNEKGSKKQNSPNNPSEVRRLLYDGEGGLVSNQDSFGFGPVLDKITVTPPTTDSQHGVKILCFVNTHEKYHDTKAQAVMDTWGPKCDKLVFASSLENDYLGAVRIPNTDFSYDSLWNKHRETLRYVYETYAHDYEWFIKADDDTFLIMENLREYLGSKEIQDQHRAGIPLHIGNRYTMNVDEDGVLHDGNERGVYDKDLWDRFLDKTDNKFVFNVGGAGYAMNKAFLQSMMDWIDEPECAITKDVSTLLDDALLSFCSSNFGAFPYDARDELGRERFHQDSPALMYSMPRESKMLYELGKRHTGGFQVGEDCCSTKSISFHHMSPAEMRAAYEMLYVDKQHELIAPPTLDLSRYLSEDEFSRDSESLQQRISLLTAEALRGETSEWPPYGTVARIADEMNRVVIVTVNCGMVDFGDNLATSMLQFGAANVVFVPLDELSYQVLLHSYPDNVVPPMPGLKRADTEAAEWGSEAFKHATKSRALTIQRFLELEFTVLYIDSDMVWRSNVLDLMREEASFSPASANRPAVFMEDKGRTADICSCMIYMHPTPENIAMLGEWDNEMSNYYSIDSSLGFVDDQEHLNTVLRRKEKGQAYRVLNANDFFPNGHEYFELWNDKQRSSAYLVHNNWIVGKQNKYDRFKDGNLWNLSGRLDSLYYDCQTSIVEVVSSNLIPPLDGSISLPFKASESRQPENVPVQQNRTLVSLIAGVRGGEPTWNSLYEHVLDVNNADLVLVVGAQTDRSSSLYKRAKYIWEFPEYTNWNEAFDDYFGTDKSDEHSWHQLATSPEPWRPFGANSSGAIQGLAKWILAEKLKAHGLVENYDRFVVTRSDQYYPCDLPLDTLDMSKIWVPTGEDSGGITDRFAVFGKDHILKALDTHSKVIRNPVPYYGFDGNAESFVKSRWVEDGLFEHVRRFRRRMFTAYSAGDKTRWWANRLKKAFVEDGVQINYKYDDEIYQAMSSCAAAPINFELNKTHALP